MEFLSGFVSILGSPNVGKSTLLNYLIGQKVSIVSPKAQTTRNRIMGVLTREEYQVVFLDTPGVTTPKNKLGEYMLNTAYEAMNEVECILFVADATNGIREKDRMLLEKVKRAKAKKLAIVNKIDAAAKPLVEQAKQTLEETGLFEDVILISALTGEGTQALLDAIKGYLVPGPKYFPDDMVTDQPERVVCAELIREKMLLCLKDEVPHGIGVDIEKMGQRPDRPEIIDINALILCERDAHKGIIIGKQGAMLKKIGSLARADIEWLLGSKVNLQLYVKVKKDWRNLPSTMRELGYE